MQTTLFNDIRKYTLLFSLSLLAACSGDSNESNMNLTDKLNPTELAALTQWLNENKLSINQFKLSDEGFTGEYALVIENNQLVGLKSKGVRNADGLANLPALKKVEISFFEDMQFTECNPELEYLKINGLRHQTLSLSFLSQCANLKELNLFYAQLSDWSVMSSLSKLEQLTVRFSDIKTLTFAETLPSLRRVDLTNNQLNHLSFNVPQTKLNALFLSDNQFSVIPDFSVLSQLETLSLDNNPLMTLNAAHLPSQLKTLDLRKTMILDFEPLANLSNLQRVQVQRKPKGLPASLIDKVYAAISDESQLIVAEDLMEKYLGANQFIEKLPKAVNGKALGLHKESQQLFSHSGTSQLSGTIEIEEIQGMMRIPLAQTDNLLYQQRLVTINGQVSVVDGVFKIYSPVEVNFWQMAGLFVDNPQKEAPASSNLNIKGFIVYEVLPDQAVSFQANLIPMADRYLLLVGSDVATGVNIKYE